MPADATLTSDQKRIIAELKSDERSASLPILGPDDAEIGRLTPVTPSLAEKAEVIHSLCRWRTAHALSFLTVFTPTFDNVQGYLLRYSLPDPARVLFLMHDADARLVGNIGFCNVTSGGAELDNVLRGEAANPRTIMTEGQRTLLDWAFRILRVPLVSLDVLADNLRAVHFYQRAGFSTVGRIPLARKPLTDGYRLIPVKPHDQAEVVAHLARMELPARNWYSRASPRPVGRAS